MKTLLQLFFIVQDNTLNKQNTKCVSYIFFYLGPNGSMSQVFGLPNNSYTPITYVAWVRARLFKLQKGALDSQRQVMQFASCLPIVCGFFRVFRLPSSFTKSRGHDIAELLLNGVLAPKINISIDSIVGLRMSVPLPQTNYINKHKISQNHKKGKERTLHVKQNTILFQIL